jgi:hypothetical protein
MKKKYSEDAPTNSTGPAIPGTGSDVAHWKKKKKKKTEIVRRVKKKLKATYEVGRKPDPELVLKKEGKNMDWFHKLIKQGKSAEEISRIMELDRDTVEALMEIEFHEAMIERNYRKEYDNYHAKPEQREKNAARLRARRLMVKKGKVEKNDKKDVHHKDNNPLNNDTKNLSVVTQKYNRTEPRRRNEDVDGVPTPTPVPTPDSTFASMPVFKVNSDDFIKCQHGKQKHAHWNKHIDTKSEYGMKIHTYAKKNPKQSIIVQDDKSGHMVYLKKYSQLKGDK